MTMVPTMAIEIPIWVVMSAFEIPFARLSIDDVPPTESAWNVCINPNKAMTIIVQPPEIQ